VNAAALALEGDERLRPLRRFAPALAPSAQDRLNGIGEFRAIGEIERL
jgi:hypothetical protein